MAVSANLTWEVSLTSSAGICISTSIPSLSYVGDHVIKIRGRTFNAIVHASNCKLRDPQSPLSNVLHQTSHKSIIVTYIGVPYR